MVYFGVLELTYFTHHLLLLTMKGVVVVFLLLLIQSLLYRLLLLYVTKSTRRSVFLMLGLDLWNYLILIISQFLLMVFLHLLPFCVVNLPNTQQSFSDFSWLMTPQAICWLIHNRREHFLVMVGATPISPHTHFRFIKGAKRLGGKLHLREYWLRGSSLRNYCGWAVWTKTIWVINRRQRLHILLVMFRGGCPWEWHIWARLYRISHTTQFFSAFLEVFLDFKYWAGKHKPNCLCLCYSSVISTPNCITPLNNKNNIILTSFCIAMCIWLTLLWYELVNFLETLKLLKKDLVNVITAWRLHKFQNKQKLLTVACLLSDRQLIILGRPGAIRIHEIEVLVWSRCRCLERVASRSSVSPIVVLEHLIASIPRLFHFKVIWIK